jgi:3-phenylpropionate/trans-cinnamate dioxygenase ferredoxin component
MSFERVAHESDLPDGGMVAVTLSSGDRVCIIRMGQDVFAIANECTHAGFPMTDGSVSGDCEIECALHGAVFNLRDGSVVEGPADEPIRTYRVKTIDGEIWVGPD